MKLLLTGSAGFDKKQIKLIEELGWEIYFLQYEKDNLPLSYEQIDAVIGNGLFLYHDIRKFSNLKYIQLSSAGYDRVPLDYIYEKKITIHNAHGVYSIPMAEFVFSCVLSIYKKTIFFERNQRNHQWEKNRGIIDLYKKRVGILGCGSVGKECAKRFSAFGCYVMGVDVKPVVSEFFHEFYGFEQMSQVLEKVDILILSLPLTKTTRHLMNEESLKLLKKHSILVNISRGEIIDTDALLKVLKEKQVYMILDVFEQEPLPHNHPLWDMENVILTPHNSFVSDQNVKRLFELTLENLMNWRKINESKNSIDSCE